MRDKSLYYKIIQLCKPIKEIKYNTKYKNIKKYMYLEKNQHFPIELCKQNKFFQIYDRFIVIPSLLFSDIDFFTFRAIEEKRFQTIGESSVYFLYGIDSSFEKFRYGNTLVLTEGAMDCDTVKMFYPYCISMSTANISINQLEVLTSMTNRFALLLDDDDAGRKATLKSIKMLKKSGAHIEILKQFAGLKDIADLFTKSDFERDIIVDYYNSLLPKIN